MKNICNLFLICSLLFSNRLSGQTLFSAPKNIDSATYINGRTKYLIDIDLDGDKDLLVFLPDEKRVLWYEQDEDHFFKQNHIISEVLEFYYEGNMCPVDMDHDGDPDILEIQNNIADNLAWYENDGSGNFSNKHIISTIIFNSNNISTYDMDNDGDEDIILSNNSTNKAINWIENLGAGNFGASQNLVTTTLDLYDFTVTAFDGNSSPEILYRTQFVNNDSRGTTLHCVRKDVAGSYSLDQVIADSLARIPLIVRDIDMDNIPDIITIKYLKYETGPIIWFKNGGDAFFGAEKYLSPTSDCRNIEVADFDQDGNNDVFCIYNSTYETAKDFRIYLNNGSGLFVEGILQTVNLDKYINTVYVTDWNNDQKLDLFLLSRSTIFRFQNIGDGNFDKGEKCADGDINNYGFIALDINGDGKKDLVNIRGGETIWYQNTDNQEFTRPKRLLPEFNLSENRYADLDQDGDLDLIRSTSYDLKWHPNDGAGHFGAGNLIFNSFEVFIIITSDIDLDGDLDLLFYSSTALVGKPTIVIYKNDGIGNFSFVMNLTFDDAIFDSYLLTDLNGDHYPDILLYNTVQKLVWYKNDGSGQFGPETDISTIYTSGFASADVDHDGDNDIITANYLPSNNISIFKNNGNGIFSTPQQQNIGLDNFEVAFFDLGDVDHDGFMDVILSGFTKGLIWSKNDGNGNMQQATLIETTRFWDIKLDDLDSDGDLDIYGRTFAPLKFDWVENLSITPTSTPLIRQTLISLTPNPAASETQINIQSDLLQNQYLIDLQDLNGKTLNTYKTNDSNFTLQRNGLPAGAYFLRVREAQSGKLLGVEQLIWH